MQKVNNLGNGRYSLTCMECDKVSPVFDREGKEISDKQINEEHKNWR
jgi:hypothetical protein